MHPQDILQLLNESEGNVFNVPANGTEKKVKFRINKVAHEPLLLLGLLIRNIIFFSVPANGKKKVMFRINKVAHEPLFLLGFNRSVLIV